MPFVAAKALLLLLAAGVGGTTAARSLQQGSNPSTRQYVQITLSLRGGCGTVQAINPTILNDMRLGAIADVRTALTANPTGIVDLPATLSSVRAGPVTCAPVAVCAC